MGRGCEYGGAHWRIATGTHLVASLRPNILILLAISYSEARYFLAAHPSKVFVSEITFEAWLKKITR